MFSTGDFCGWSNDRQHEHPDVFLRNRSDERDLPGPFSDRQRTEPSSIVLLVVGGLGAVVGSAKAGSKALAECQDLDVSGRGRVIELRGRSAIRFSEAGNDS